MLEFLFFNRWDYLNITLSLQNNVEKAAPVENGTHQPPENGTAEIHNGKSPAITPEAPSSPIKTISKEEIITKVSFFFFCFIDFRFSKKSDFFIDVKTWNDDRPLIIDVWWTSVIRNYLFDDCRARGHLINFVHCQKKALPWIFFLWLIWLFFSHYRPLRTWTSLTRRLSLPLLIAMWTWVNILHHLLSI